MVDLSATLFIKCESNSGFRISVAMEGVINKMYLKDHYLNYFN